MPLQDDMQLISVDDHIIEHPTVWTSRLPAKYQEMAPHVVELTEDYNEPDWNLHVAKGREVWVYEGRIFPQVALNAVAGRPPEEINIEPFRYSDIREGCYRPAARVEDMDLAGVTASLSFATFPGFAGSKFMRGEDKELATLCVRAYNDFILEEWYAYAPDRFIPLMLLPTWDPAAMVREIERTAPLGARAVALPDTPVPQGMPSYHSDYWFPVWDAIQAHDLPACVHVGSSGTVPQAAPDAPLAVGITLVPINSMFAFAELLWSPIFTNFPGVKFVLSEGGIGWVPAMLERADHVWEVHRFFAANPGARRPSDVFRESIFTCYIDDVVGLKIRHDIGIDHIMWESDYPHADTNWPHSRKVAAEQLRDVPDPEAAAIVELNARRLFHFPRS
jgi:predicted TIM-barrel fold metal-dependent hydrolase